MAKKKLRPLGDITEDMEPILYDMAESGNITALQLVNLLDECFKGHKLQLHELFGIISYWNNSHGMSFSVDKLQELFEIIHIWAIDCYPEAVERYSHDGSSPTIGITTGKFIDYGPNKE
jgi:hypothetical protein